MKRNPFLLLACLSIFVLPALHAQQNLETKQILDKLSSNYQSITSFSMDFNYNLINEKDGIDLKFSGSLISKGERYRLNMESQQVANDGSTIYTYLPDINELTIDNYDPDEEDITLNSIFHVHNSGYKFNSLPSQVINGKSYYMIDLVPEDRDNQFFKIRLAISEDFFLHQWQMWDRSGSRYLYSVDNFTANIEAPDSLFQMDKSSLPGVEIVDLR